jgi:hypothetical protein
MKFAISVAIALCGFALCGRVAAEQTMVVINLTEQAAYLIKDGRVAIVSPIASGKDGWGTPTGNFRVISKDLNHKSGSFGLIVDRSGRIVNPNATPGSYIPAGCYYMPARCRISWNSAGVSACMPATFQVTPRHTVAFGCPRANRHAGESPWQREKCNQSPASYSSCPGSCFAIRHKLV